MDKFINNRSYFHNLPISDARLGLYNKNKTIPRSEDKKINYSVLNLEEIELQLKNQNKCLDKNEGCIKMLIQSFKKYVIEGQKIAPLFKHCFCLCELQGKFDEELQKEFEKDKGLTNLILYSEPVE